eukprot:CAMPEP_0118966300 /NCGR_PEP_ID=MMETSP1173-20130426/3780_1 /TAXON_ID=1034831 /ORGANISM="Rhizochromulina marina cf, Strain CCMP1243" /LENGTH=157 /DNA_ID=CAMNT_0006915057 /DNA_START=229 /DNA_END=702 /DNA_ORIENTATION=-
MCFPPGEAETEPARVSQGVALGRWRVSPAPSAFNAPLSLLAFLALSRAELHRVRVPPPTTALGPRNSSPRCPGPTLPVWDRRGEGSHGGGAPPDPTQAETHRAGQNQDGNENGSGGYAHARCRPLVPEATGYSVGVQVESAESRSKEVGRGVSWSWD